MQQDPFRYLDSSNLYIYERDRPLKLLDPTGKGIFKFIGWIIGSKQAYDCKSFAKIFCKYEKECQDAAEQASKDGGTLGYLNWADQYQDCGDISPLVHKNEARYPILCCVQHKAKDAGEDMTKFNKGFQQCLKALLKFVRSG
jgi:hypothetical protein